MELLRPFRISFQRFNEFNTFGKLELECSIFTGSGAGLSSETREPSRISLLKLKDTLCVYSVMYDY